MDRNSVAKLRLGKYKNYRFTVFFDTNDNRIVLLRYGNLRSWENPDQWKIWRPQPFPSKKENVIVNIVQAALA